LTGDEKYTDHIVRGQRVILHSLPTLLYFLFSPPQIFFNSILCRPAIGTLAFAPTAQASPSGKSQNAVFCQITLNNDVSYLNYQAYPDYTTMNSNFLKNFRQ